VPAKLADKAASKIEVKPSDKPKPDAKLETDAKSQADKKTDAEKPDSGKLLDKAPAKTIDAWAENLDSKPATKAPEKDAAPKKEANMVIEDVDYDSDFKEGGEAEATEYFDVKRFIKDLRGAWNLTIISSVEAMTLVNEVFNLIKRWHILTGNSLAIEL